MFMSLQMLLLSCSVVSVISSASLVLLRCLSFVDNDLLSSYNSKF